MIVFLCLDHLFNITLREKEKFSLVQPHSKEVTDTKLDDDDRNRETHKSLKIQDNPEYLHVNRGIWNLIFGIIKHPYDEFREVINQHEEGIMLFMSV